MEAEATGAGPVGVASRVLEGQERLIAADLQHRRWQTASERAAFSLRVLIGLAGLVVAACLAVMAWQASRASGLVVEAFSAPPDMAAWGVTGQVAASQVLDRYNAIQALSNSIRPRQGSESAWTERATIEIPQTGVSIGELQRFLRGWLGNERRVTGEVFRTAGGVSLTVRVEGLGAETVEGDEAELPRLFQAAAERLLWQTDRTRYGMLLARRGEAARAEAVFQELSRSRDPDERAYALTQIARFAPLEGAIELNLRAARTSRYVAAVAVANAGVVLRNLGRDEAAYQTGRRAFAALRAIEGNPEEPLIRRQLETGLARNLGDTAGAYAAWMDGPNTRWLNRASAHLTRASLLADLHQPAAAAAALASAPPPPEQLVEMATAEAAIAGERGDWTAAVARLEHEKARLAALPEGRERANGQAKFDARAAPMLAEALAELGRYPEAAVAIAPAPRDSYPAARARARIAHLAGRRSEADRWWTEAVRLGPSLPRAEEEWARALLARGNAKAALEKARAATRKGRRFPDALEAHGEALLALGDAKAAEAKFAEAAKLSPRWGRLQARWADALAALGRRDEAVSRGRLALSLELTPAERTRVMMLLQKQTG